METAILILLLLIIWISLYNKINSASSQIDSLTKEITRLKKLLELGEKPVAKEKNKLKEEKVEQDQVCDPYLKVLSIEEKDEEKIVPEIKDTSNKLSTKVSKVAPPVVAKEKKKREPINWEKYIGENLFGKIGILVLVIGIGFFVKYAIDKNYINETVRTVMGFVSGAVLLIIAWKLKNRYRTYSSLLTGGAFAIFYVTVAMAYHYYGLFSQPVAFIILVAVTILMAILAVLYDHRELAIIAIGGGFIAPFLVSNGSGNYLVLFTYVMILDLGMFILSMYKKWGELLIICFVLSWLVIFGFTMAADPYSLKEMNLTHFLLFSMAFYLIFLLSAVFIVKVNQKGLINRLLLFVVTLNNFVFLGFVYWYLYIMEVDLNLKGIFTLYVGIVNLLLFFWTKKKGLNFKFLYYTLLSVALLFFSITIPIQLEGTFITLFWASEMVIVMWLFTRYRIRVFEVFAFLLPILTCISLILDMEIAISGGIQRLFVNGTFATSIFSGIAFILYALMQKRIGRKNGWSVIIACIILYTAFILDFNIYLNPWQVSYSYIQGFTTLVLLGLTVLFGYKQFPVSIHYRKYMTWLGISLILFLIYSFTINDAYHPRAISYVIQWVCLVLLGVHIFMLAKIYYQHFPVKTKKANKITLYLSVISTIWLLIGTNNMLHQLSLSSEVSAGFSVALGIAGFIQMALGMRLHLKNLRMISLGTFGIVLLKLIMIDLWLLPTVGKVIVFILLGIILLVLSFLYQKLKIVLFNDQEENNKRNEPPLKE